MPASGHDFQGRPSLSVAQIHVDHPFVANTIHQIPGTPIHEPRVIELTDITFVEWGLHRLTAYRVDGDDRQELAIVEFSIVPA